MKLSEEQLNLVFSAYLDTHVLPGSFDHHPVFETLDRGAVLTRRLKKILREKELRHTHTSTSFDVVELSKLAQEFLKKYKKVYIVGLNHWFTKKDLDVIMGIINNYFY
jgi:hypothetical protein